MDVLDTLWLGERSIPELPSTAFQTGVVVFMWDPQHYTQPLISVPRVPSEGCAAGFLFVILGSMFLLSLPTWFIPPPTRPPTALLSGRGIICSLTCVEYSSYNAPSGWDIVQSSSALSGCTFVLCQGHSTSHSDVIEVVCI